jgi:hypothetical protein
MIYHVHYFVTSLRFFDPRTTNAVSSSIDVEIDTLGECNFYFDAMPDLVS